MKIRYNRPPAQRPKIGETRQRLEFLWLPLRIGTEIRWLEVAQWEERFQPATVLGDINDFLPNEVTGRPATVESTGPKRWIPIRWVDRT